MTKRSNECRENLPELEKNDDESNLHLMVELLFPFIGKFHSINQVIHFVTLNSTLWKKWLFHAEERLVVFRNIINFSNNSLLLDFHGLHYLHKTQSVFAIMLEYTIGAIKDALSINASTESIPSVTIEYGDYDLDLEDMNIYYPKQINYSEVWAAVEHALDTKESIVEQFVDDEMGIMPITRTIMSIVRLKMKLRYGIELCLYKIDDDHHAMYSYECVDPEDLIGFVPVGMRIDSVNSIFELDINDHNDNQKK